MKYIKTRFCKWTGGLIVALVIDMIAQQYSLTVFTTIKEWFTPVSHKTATTADSPRPPQKTTPEKPAEPPSAPPSQATEHNPTPSGASSPPDAVTPQTQPSGSHLTSDKPQQSSNTTTATSHGTAPPDAPSTTTSAVPSSAPHTGTEHSNTNSTSDKNMTSQSLKGMAVTAFLTATALIANIVTVPATGTGTTYRNAVNEALITAMEQKCGVSISSSVHSQLTSAERVEAVSENGNATMLAINDSIANEMKKWSQGRITGYQVTSQSYDQATKLYTVNLQVSIPGEYIVGLNPNNRRRMAIAPFTAAQPTVSIYGNAIATAEWSKRFTDKLNTHFTQTRKFTMLDRSFEADVQKELAIIAGPNAAPGEVIRIDQTLGTDYLVVGTIALHDLPAPLRHPSTGQLIPVKPTAFAEIHYRVILAPTGQLKWSKTVTISTPQLPATATLLDVINVTAELAATNITDTIMNCILPLEVVGKTADGRVIIGEGGQSLLVGDYLNAYAQGETVTDTRTGEEIGKVESCIAVLQVLEVTERMSYAQVMQGDINTLEIGTVLRRPKPQSTPPIQQPAGPPTTVETTPGGGVNVPF